MVAPRHVLAVVLTLSASSLCAAAWAAASPAAREDPAIARGAELAQERCASCHGVALETASPVHDAPLFRVLSRLYPAEVLRMRLLEIVENGHFEMPRVRLREDEVADVAAYIASLDGGAVETPRRGRAARPSRK